jgi:RNA polymerase sigma-70 factor, ECF subfamily
LQVCCQKGNFFFISINFIPREGSYPRYMEQKMTDHHLLALLKDESSRKEGMAVLINSYQAPLYWHIRKMILSHDDSKDVLQEVFVRVWRNIGKFKGDSSVFTWLFRIASNESIRFLEKKQRQQVHKMNIQEILIKELETEPFISGDEIQLALQKALFGLTDRQRLVFNMRYFDEMDYTEIASILETTVNNVKVLYHNAKNQVQETIKKEL